ncbi:uncharacterized protein LOC143431805 [Xylocopa sonorina]|uniref:uncharacterized protein LOC143431805 n=1 Tax=Xylocopa sonorina TaxID=1818115 RepID=UPI00403AB8FD
MKIPRNLQLADPTFYCPALVDLLLGAGAALALLHIYISKSRGSDGNLYHTTTTLLPDITQFWEIEEVPRIQRLSEPERACEAHYRLHITQNADGTYIVAIPFNDQVSRVGESRYRDLKCFTALEEKLERDTILRREYHAVIQEYLDLGHVSEIYTSQDVNEGYYLPHHGVTEISSQMNKLWVAFDDSASPTTGISLNDTLHIRPKIQEDLIHILIRFHTHKYAITGDIEKMFRQFIVRLADRKYQRILWRNATGNIRTYQLNTVTFVLSAVPFLAIHCLTQLANAEEHRFTNVSCSLRRDFYVDDALTGASTAKETITVREELFELLQTTRSEIR